MASLEDYTAVLERISTLETKIEEVIGPIIAFTDLYHQVGWKGILIGDHRTHYGAPNVRSNFPSIGWPDINVIASMINEWHGAVGEARSMFLQLTPQQRQYVRRPPDAQ